MGRKCKCQWCEKQINTDDAYRVEVNLQNGKSKNEYFCNETHYRLREQNVWLYRKNQKLIDEILQYTCKNNAKNKMLSSLYEDYTRKEVYDCILELKNMISDSLEFRRDIENEYGKLRYIFTIIESNIKEITERNRSAKQIEENESKYKDNDGELQDEKPMHGNKRKSLRELLEEKKKIK